MSLPINIEDLLSGAVVEGERIEYKEGWNPGSIMRTVCAFANDFDNLGSGYIVVGVQEQDGRAVRPVLGFEPNQLEKIQREMNGYANLVRPPYFPRLFLEAVDEKWVLVIWVPAGSNRPYQVPREVGSKTKDYQYYIRKYSNSIIPSKDQEIELIQLTSRIPFDDRVNTHANVNELSFSLMRDHLYQTGSKLHEESAKMGVRELAVQMNLAEGANEHLFPKNVGLLMFTPDPEKYFKGSKIDVVEFPHGLGATEFFEKSFTGPIQKQLTDVLGYLRNNVLKSKVIKFSDRAESLKVFNYPYEALEEALSNAVYHRNYELQEPIEVRVLPASIEIISYGGPDPSLRQIDFDKGVIRARRYRNRRIGEFLKELRLTEGRGTGIPTIIRVLQENGSGKPLFDTDGEERRYFIIEIPIHPAFEQPRDDQETPKKSDQVSDQVTGQSDQVSDQVAGENEQVKWPKKFVIASKKGKDISIGFEKIIAAIEGFLSATPSSFTPKDLEKYKPLINELTDEQFRVLKFCHVPQRRKDILEECLRMSNHTTNYQRHVEPLLNLKLLDRLIKDKPQSQHQKYITTEKGSILLFLKEEINKA